MGVFRTLTPRRRTTRRTTRRLCGRSHLNLPMHICFLFRASFSISYAAQQAYEKEQFELPQPDPEFLAWKFKGACMTAPFYVRYYSCLTMSSIFTILFAHFLCPFPSNTPGSEAYRASEYAPLQRARRLGRPLSLFFTYHTVPLPNSAQGTVFYSIMGGREKSRQHNFPRPTRPLNLLCPCRVPSSCSGSAVAATRLHRSTSPLSHSHMRVR